MDYQTLERSAKTIDNSFQNIIMGVGTWQWGDRVYWGFGSDYDEEDVQTAFSACLENGMNFFDSSEVYGMGKSESFLGRFITNNDKPVMVASKFMPFPWRLGKSSLHRALRKSLRRLRLDSIDLYQIHMPLPPITIETWMESMLDVYQMGLIKAIGVCNFNKDQVQRAYDVLIHNGIRLASCQIEFNILSYSEEQKSLLRLCQELDIRVIAYSPLSQGSLTGKYDSESIPKGIRGRKYNRKYFESIQPLLRSMKKIGADHAGKSCTQVALNWVICKGAIPIPGVKNLDQAEENSGAIGWRLSGEEIELLDHISSQVQSEFR